MSEEASNAPPSSAEPKGGKPTSEPKAGKPKGAKKPAAAAEKHCRVFMRKPFAHGTRPLEADELVAEFRLAPGMSWQFVVDAIKNDLARVDEADEE